MINKLIDENNKLKKCVEFYADKENWGTTTDDHTAPIIDNSDLELNIKSIIWGDNDENETMYSCGGKLARQTIKELNE